MHFGILLYADDLQFFKQIQTDLDAQQLQDDIHSLVAWSYKNNLPSTLRSTS